MRNVKIYSKSHLFTFILAISCHVKSIFCTAEKFEILVDGSYWVFSLTTVSRRWGFPTDVKMAIVAKGCFCVVKTARCTAIWSEKVVGKGTLKLSYKLKFKNNILMCKTRGVKAGKCNSWIHCGLEIPDNWARPEGKFICNITQIANGS